MWHHDLALHYYTHGPLRLAVWGRWQEDEGGPIDATYEVLKAREFRYDSARGRYLSVDIATPYDGSQYWELNGDPIWTDYEGDTPYADSTMSTSTYALTQSNRFFGLTGEKDTSSSDESYWQGDLIGSTMATTDEDGAAAASPLSYTAFGELLDSNGAPGGAAPSGMQRYQYGGEWGYETDRLVLAGGDSSLPPITLQHLGWRWYEPEIGRFVQRDPITICGGRNVYVYAGNSPVTFYDPRGLTYILPPSWNDWLAGRWRRLLGDDYLAQASDGELVAIATGTSVGIVGTGYGAYWGVGWLCGGGWAQVGWNSAGVVIRSGASRAATAAAPWAIHLGSVAIGGGVGASGALPMIPVRFPDAVTLGGGLATNCFWGAMQGLAAGF